MLITDLPHASIQESKQKPITLPLQEVMGSIYKDNESGRVYKLKWNKIGLYSGSMTSNLHSDLVIRFN
jgi:hypothetical protein